MKQPNINEVIAMIQCDHELQATIDSLDLFMKKITDIINAKSAQKIHLIVDGDTLRTLAFRYYNDMTYWTKLGQYNSLTTSTLTKGNELIIPEKSELDKWQLIQD